MGSAIGLLEDFGGSAGRRLARLSKSSHQARRLLALARFYDGRSRSEAAKIGGVTLQIVRDWVIRFNARGPDGLLDGKAPGKRSILTDAQPCAHRGCRARSHPGGPRRCSLAADRSGAVAS